MEAVGSFRVTGRIGFRFLDDVVLLFEFAGPRSAELSLPWSLIIYSARSLLRRRFIPWLTTTCVAPGRSSLLALGAFSSFGSPNFGQAGLFGNLGRPAEWTPALLHEQGDPCLHSRLARILSLENLLEHNAKKRHNDSLKMRRKTLPFFVDN